MMSRLEAWLMHLSIVLVGGTGLVYAVMRYILRSPDPEAVVNHPWQPAVQHLHLLAAPLLVFAVGVVWRRHVWAGLCSGQAQRWRSGLVLILTFVPMVVSGYLVQVAVGEGWRRAWVGVHLVASGAWILGYLIHGVGAMWARARAGRGRPLDLEIASVAVPRGGERRAARRRLRPVAFLALASLAGPPEVDGAEVERRLEMMGTTLSVVVEAGEREAALEASERAVRTLAETEARLSTWRETSELARLNRAPAGEAVALSPELEADLSRARRWWVATGGAFDPGIGALVEAWGLRRGGRLPSPAEREAALASSGVALLEIGEGVAIRRHPGLRLDEGAFGKGAGLDRAVRALAACGIRRATLDLGGQVAVVGGVPTPVGVADPRRRNRVAIVLTIDSGSVATSGNSEHGMVIGGARYGHIFDPRRGEPAPDFGSVTVWAPDAMAADCLSTGLYVLGPGAALAWAAERPGTEVLVLEPVGERLRGRATPGLAGRLSAPAEDLDLDLDLEREGGGAAPALTRGSGSP